MRRPFDHYRKRFLEEWFNFNLVGMFVLLCIGYFALLFIKRVYIIDSIAAFEILSETGDIWIFNFLYGLQYLSIPLFLIWKLTWTTLILWIGSFMFGYRLHFNQLWKLVLLVEVFFFIPELGKIFWFTIIYTDPTYYDYMAFYPFAVLNLIDYEAIHIRYHYPLKTLNLFEVTYWFLLVFGIYFLSGKKLKIAYAIVFSSYVFCLLLWLIFYVNVY